MELEINGKKVDLSKALPLKVKDWRRLKTEYGIEVTTLNNPEFDHIVNYVAFVLNKANNKITVDDVDELADNELTELFGYIGDTLKENKLDRPTLKVCTS